MFCIPWLDESSKTGPRERCVVERHTGDDRSDWPRRLAEVAIACFGYFSIALVLLHGLRPDYTPIGHMISD